MLLSLSIRDFVLIEKLDLDFRARPDSGLGALTGETGAGKSILIDALGLALGARADIGARCGAARPRLRSRPRSSCRRTIRPTRSSPSRASTTRTC